MLCLMWVIATQFIKVLNRMKGRGKMNLLSACLLELGHQSSLTFGKTSSQAFRLRWNLHHQLSGSQIFELHHWLSWFPSLQMVSHGTSQLS